MVQSTDKLQSMENFASYLANLPKTPLVEAVTALYESTTSTQIAPSEQEIFDTVIADIKFKLNACWDRTVSEMRKINAFKFHCIVYDRFHNIIDGIAPDVYITFLHDTPQFDNEPNSIEIVSDNPALMQCYMASQDNGITSEMKAEVTAAILDLIRKNTQYIKERIHEILATDISEHTDMAHTTVLWRIDDLLSSESPDYKMMPFLQFAHQCLNKSPIDALKYLAELVDTCGGKVASTDYTAIVKLASYGNWTTAQVINYLTGVYNIGNYLGCSGVLQLNNGMLYSDGYVYDRNDVNKYLKHLYDTTFYEDVVEEWNDHDYRRESLIHQLRGNRYPLPREHTVHRLKNGEAPEYRTWVSTVDQSTGKRPIDTVLDQLKTSGNAKHVKQNNNLNWLISQSGKLPSVESSRKSATALYESVEDTALTPFDDGIDIDEVMLHTNYGAHGDQEYQDPDYADRVAYVKRVIAGMKFPLRVWRALKLYPGKELRLGKDIGHYWTFNYDMFDRNNSEQWFANGKWNVILTGTVTEDQVNWNATITALASDYNPKTGWASPNAEFEICLKRDCIPSELEIDTDLRAIQAD